MENHRNLIGDSRVEKIIGSCDKLLKVDFFLEKYCLTTSASDKNPNLIATKLYNWKHIDGKSQQAELEIALEIVFKLFLL